MMKLRLRSLETRETVKVEVPFQCSIQQLKRILSQTLSSSSNSYPTSPDSLRLTLNKSDEIQSSSPEEDTLQSIGITSGDLIFYTVVSSQALIPNPQIPISTTPRNSNDGLSLGHKDGPEPSSIVSENPRSIPDSITNQNSIVHHNPGREPDVIEERNPHIAEPNLPLQRDGQFDAQPEEELPENMEIDEDDGDVSAGEFVGKSFSVPGFLRKVFTEQLDGDDGGSSKHKLLVIAVHAVLLESGFLGFDMESKNLVKGLKLENGWPSNSFRLSLYYTLPEITENGECQNCAFSLKFQVVGKYMNVYGSLCSGSVTHSVRLNEDELMSYFNVIWANCGLSDDIVTSEGGILGTSPEKEVFKFWRNVKDNLALPLLIEICEKNGLGLPPCLARLPTDLKLKILELLPGVDVAKTSCVSSEMRYLASSDDLWKQKFAEQFGDAGKSDDKGPWKEKFARSWESQKRRKFASSTFIPRGPMYPRAQRFPGAPRIGGGPPIFWVSANPSVMHPSSQSEGIRFLQYSPFPSFSSVSWNSPE